MKMQKFALTGAVAALLALTAAGYAADAAATGSVSGKVNGADGKPVGGATVTLTVFSSVKPTAADKKAPGMKATTETDGTFKIESVPAGPYKIRAVSKGVGSVTSQVTVTAGQDFPITLQLKAAKKKAS